MRLVTFVRGAAIGFILGVLFAPDKGKATRRKIAGMASDIKEDMDETCRDLGNAIREKVQQIKNDVQDITGSDENISIG